MHVGTNYVQSNTTIDYSTKDMVPNNWFPYSYIEHHRRGQPLYKGHFLGSQIIGFPTVMYILNAREQDNLSIERYNYSNEEKKKYPSSNVVDQFNLAVVVQLHSSTGDCQVKGVCLSHVDKDRVYARTGSEAE